MLGFMLHLRPNFTPVGASGQIGGVGLGCAPSSVVRLRKTVGSSSLLFSRGTVKIGTSAPPGPLDARSGPAAFSVCPVNNRAFKNPPTTPIVKRRYGNTNSGNSDGSGGTLSTDTAGLGSASACLHSLRKKAEILAKKPRESPRGVVRWDGVRERVIKRQRGPVYPV